MEALRKIRSPTVRQGKQHYRLPNRGIIISMAMCSTALHHRARPRWKSLLVLIHSVLHRQMTTFHQNKHACDSFFNGVVLELCISFDLKRRHGRFSSCQHSWSWWRRFPDRWCRSVKHVRTSILTASLASSSLVHFIVVILNNARRYVKTASSC